MFAKDYQCSPMLTNVNQCFQRVTTAHQYSLMFTNVFHCFPLFSNVHQCSPRFPLKFPLARSPQVFKCFFSSSLCFSSPSVTFHCPTSMGTTGSEREGPFFNLSPRKSLKWPDGPSTSDPTTHPLSSERKIRLLLEEHFQGKYHWKMC